LANFKFDALNAADVARVSVDQSALIEVRRLVNARLRGVALRVCHAHRASLHVVGPCCLSLSSKVQPTNGLLPLEHAPATRWKS
jgi:hypothetical protein